MKGLERELMDALPLYSWMFTEPVTRCAGGGQKRRVRGACSTHAAAPGAPPGSCARRAG